MEKEKLKYRTLRNLVDVYDKVYIRIKDTETMEHFIKQLDKEGFTYGDGERPSNRRPMLTMTLMKPCEIGYIGYVGNVAVGAIVNKGNNSSIPVVEYDRYINNEKRFKTKMSDVV